VVSREHVGMPRGPALVLVTFLAGMTAGAAPPDAALPHVRIKNIGLHIGGGPNDAATKGPFLKAIEARFDDFRRCYGKIETPREKGTFGIDLLVPKDGGHAETSNPRTAMKGDAFRACVIEVFERVAFDPPKRGPTKLSYALAFEPE
jgi:hypothetical protein